MEANSTTIEKVKSNFNTNISYLNNASKEQTKEETVIMKYKNLPHSLNSISLKARFTYRKMLDLIDNNDKDDLTLEDLNDPKKARINNQKLNRKIIQYYCMQNVEKNKFEPPSQKVINKIQQFKKWQKFEIFQKNGIKNYINSILPDPKLIKDTRNSIDNKINLYCKMKVKKTLDPIKLPSIDTNTNNENNNTFQINSSIINNKETDLFNNNPLKINISPKEKKIIKRTKSMDELNNMNSINSTYQISYKKNPIRTKFRNKKIASLFNKRSMSLINIIDNSKKNIFNEKNNIDNNDINKEKEKDIKNFEDSIFCCNKLNIPLCLNKSITSSPYGGAIFHSNSLLRNKNMNDLVSQKSKQLLNKFQEYKSKRNRIISNKDYLYHTGKTFITINNKLSNYDYNTF
jgi:hypothetical protein